MKVGRAAGSGVHSPRVPSPSSRQAADKSPAAAPRIGLVERTAGDRAGGVFENMSVPLREVTGGPPVPDVDSLMERVRAGVADKLGRGAYSPADLEAVRRIELGTRERAEAVSTPADDIVRLHSLWDPLGPHTFTSHRGGVGTLIVTAKRWLRRLARPVAAVTLARQAEFNSVAARLLTGTIHGVHSLDAGNDALVRRLETLERSNLELRARCDELQTRIRGLEAHLESGGRAVKPG